VRATFESEVDLEIEVRNADGVEGRRGSSDRSALKLGEMALEEDSNEPVWCNRRGRGVGSASALEVTRASRMGGSGGGGTLWDNSGMEMREPEDEEEKDRDGIEVSSS
jgi:hypothetical protein